MEAARQGGTINRFDAGLKEKPPRATEVRNRRRTQVAWLPADSLWLHSFGWMLADRGSPRPKTIIPRREMMQWRIVVTREAPTTNAPTTIIHSCIKAPRHSRKLLVHAVRLGLGVERRICWSIERDLDMRMLSTEHKISTMVGWPGSAACRVHITCDA